MARPRPPLTETIAEFARTERGRQVIGITVALLLEGLMLLALLSLGISAERKPVPMADVTTFDVSRAPPPEPPAPEPERLPQEADPRPSAMSPPPPSIVQPTLPPAAVMPVAPTPAPEPVPSQATGPRPITAPPPGSRNYGPAAPTRSTDSPRVGTAPNGQPLYAATWYRRPRDDEMKGYLSTATAGYATIACRTVPDFRVEDCAVENEVPAGSQMGRAVLGMSWQFRIRPPMLGGQYQIGEWVRIRIYYDVRTDRFDYSG